MSELNPQEKKALLGVDPFEYKPVKLANGSYHEYVMNKTSGHMTNIPYSGIMKMLNENGKKLFHEGN